ncbi:MAG: DNA polymerase III subunit gamma/tau [Firmicutes bacterium]|jgi:DNA polymerase-3 subunit gamma/tau|nr:DNA polymerase III subunit gamma/tau [Bacillota bacterium]NLL89153.1 DNA polymerase III subunit gamma/tau [Bacillota bacterium]
MAYLSLYRRWRSQSFDEVVGQTHIVQALKNTLDSGKISHAYLFAGPRGTGKTTTARLFAKGLNCVDGPTSNFCGQCPQCVEITQGNSLEVIEVDGASNRGIEEIRKLRELVQYVPANGRFKVYIIDEVHMLTPGAFNALLKTLEEPPQRVVFILATTDPQKVPTTILSRCQRYDFRRFPVKDIKSHLQYVLTKEGIVPDDDALEIIAEHAGGGMRDALSIVEQCLAYSDKLSADTVSTVLGVATRERIVGFIKALDQQDSAELFKLIQDLYLDGKSLSQFVRDLLAFLRKAVVHQTTLPDIGIEWDNERLQQIMAAFSECERDMRFVSDTSIPLELAVLRLLQPPADIQGLEARIEQLEQRLANLEHSGVRFIDDSSAPKAEEKEPATVQLNPLSEDQEKLKVIQAKWQDFLQLLRNERLIQPEAFLREGFPVSLKAGQLVIAFPKGRGFHKASIEQDRHREPAERALLKMFGCSLAIKCTIGKVEQQMDTGSEGQGEPKPEQVDLNQNANEEPELQQSENKPEPGSDQKQEYDESVQAALKIFGGRVINIKDQ